jgi:hypothetical protein
MLLHAYCTDRINLFNNSPLQDAVTALKAESMARSRLVENIVKVAMAVPDGAAALVADYCIAHVTLPVPVDLFHGHRFAATRYKRQKTSNKNGDDDEFVQGLCVWPAHRRTGFCFLLDYSNIGD